MEGGKWKEGRERMDGWRGEDGWMEGGGGKDGVCGVRTHVVCGQGIVEGRGHCLWVVGFI